MSRTGLLREKSLMAPEINNPFVSKLHLSTLDKFQIAVMTVTLVPVRVIGIFSCLVVAWFFAAIALAGLCVDDLKKPMSGWRRKLTRFLTVLGRGMAFFASFQWVKVKGKQVSAREAPILVCSPHSTYLDAMVIMFLDRPPCIINRIENAAIFLIGTLTRFTQPVFVSREDPNSRQNTMKEIKRRAHSAGEWPQMIIFPEGTCTNRRCLITFKPGAFAPGVPVQPVLLRYTNKFDTYTWTWEGPTAFQTFWWTLCQLHSGLEIEFLPVYHPNEEEKNDPKLFGENVRKVMAEALGVPTTDHTYEDCRLMTYASKLDLPAASGLVEFNKLSKKLGLKWDSLQQTLEKFCALAQGQGNGQVTLEQFADYLQLPVSEPMKQLFQIYDRDASGTIDFREYVIGLHLVSQPVNTEETIMFAFQLFDQGNKGYILQDELASVLHTAFGMEEIDVGQLFSQVDADQDGKITYNEFKLYAEEKPEYAKLFTTYHELHDGEVPTKNGDANGMLPSDKLKAQ